MLKITDSMATAIDEIWHRSVMPRLERRLGYKPHLVLHSQAMNSPEGDFLLMGIDGPRLGVTLSWSIPAELMLAIDSKAHPAAEKALWQLSDRMYLATEAVWKILHRDEDLVIVPRARYEIKRFTLEEF